MCMIILKMFIFYNFKEGIIKYQTFFIVSSFSCLVWFYIKYCFTLFNGAYAKYVYYNKQIKWGSKFDIHVEEYCVISPIIKLPPDLEAGMIDCETTLTSLSIKVIMFGKNWNITCGSNKPNQTVPFFEVPMMHLVCFLCSNDKDIFFLKYF